MDKKQDQAALPLFVDISQGMVGFIDPVATPKVDKVIFNKGAATMEVNLNKIEDWNTFAIRNWRKVLQESIEQGDHDREKYARTLLKQLGYIE
jgi:hypothetical protein